MSGGSFDYAFSRLSDFIDELYFKIKNNETPDEFGDCPRLKQETIKLLKRIALIGKQYENLMKEVEWMYSGDTGECGLVEEFEKAKAKILKELK